MKTLIERQTNMPAQLSQFCAFLRSEGYKCTIDSQVEVLKILESFVPRSKQVFRDLTRAILPRDFKEYMKYPELFDQFWDEIEFATDAKERKQNKSNAATKRAPTISQLKSWLFNESAEDEEEVAQYSAAEVFARRDFAAFTDAEIEDIVQLLRQLTHILLSERSRRYVKSKRAGKLDFRKLFRRNVYHGEVLELLYRKPKIEKANILLFCDVSKSMDLYTRFILQVLFGLNKTSAKVEAFVFSTRLIRVTNDFMESDFQLALQNLSTHVNCWSGGTNIGAALTQFKHDFGQQFIHRKTTVIMVSDGWDQGDMTQMDAGMRFLKDHSRKIIWINPLASQAGYKPQTAGMQCALPYLDALTSAHNLETLMNLVKQLAA